MAIDRQLAIWRTLRGQRLKVMREFRGFTQAQMGERTRLRFGRTDYNKWENGHRPMNDEVAYRLCQALVMTPNFLFFGEIDDRFEAETSREFCARLLRARHELGLADLRSAPHRGSRPP